MNFKNFEKFESDYKKFMENNYIDFSAVKNEIDKTACVNGYANQNFYFEEKNNKGRIKLFWFNVQTKETADGDFIFIYTYLD